jgi:hypothetical protein
MGTGARLDGLLFINGERDGRGPAFAATGALDRETIHTAPA